MRYLAFVILFFGCAPDEEKLTEIEWSTLGIQSVAISPKGQEGGLPLVQIEICGSPRCTFPFITSDSTVVDLPRVGTEGELIARFNRLTSSYDPHHHTLEIWVDTTARGKDVISPVEAMLARFGVSLDTVEVLSDPRYAIKTTSPSKWKMERRRVELAETSEAQFERFSRAVH